MTLALFLLFIAAMIGVGIWGMRRTSSINDFVLGGRNIGPWIIALSFGTSYFSAVVFIGFAGKLGWGFGLEALWIPVGNSLIGALAAWLVLGRRTRRMSHNLDAMTMPEFFEARYGARMMKFVAAIIIFVFLIPYSASVFKGLGHLFEVNFGIPYEAALLIMTALTGVYLVMGGYIAASRTDFIQGIIMIAGSLALVATFVYQSGLGPSGIIEAASTRYAEHAGTPGVVPPGWFRYTLLASLVFMTSFGTWGLPQMIQKFYAIKSEHMIRKGAVVTTAFAVIVVTCAYFIGALSHTFTDDPGGQFDRLIPEMMTTYLPEPLMALMLLLILSASMSTLASLVLVSSSAVVVDVLKVHASEKISGRLQVNIMRSLTVVFLLLSFLIAVYAEKHFQFIVSLMAMSWGTVAGAFMAPYLYGLYWKGTTKAGAMAGMLSGLIIALSLMIPLGQEWLPIAATIAMIVPFGVVPVVSWMTAPVPEGILERAFRPLDEKSGENSIPGAIPDLETA